MMNHKNRKQLLLILLWSLLAAMLVLVAVNAFFIWQLYLVKPDETAVPVEQTEIFTEESEEEALALPSETLEPTPEPSATEMPVEAPTETQPAGDTIYLVRQGETLGNIAESFGVTLENLRAKNQMLGDFLLPDQRLLVPSQNEDVDTVLRFSSLTVDEEFMAVPQTSGTEDILINIYMEENRLAFQAREQLTDLVLDAFVFTGNSLEGESPATVTVYIGAGPFEGQSFLRSAYNPVAQRLYVLHDGSGDLADLNFQLAYGMGSLWGEEVWGGSPDAVLREGLPLSLADTRNQDSGNLSLCDVAKTYQDVGKLPSLTAENLDLSPWVMNMVDLSTVGCYYHYLTTLYEPDVVQNLYQTGDYSAMTSGSFAAEETLFQAWLMMYEPTQEINAVEFVEQMDRMLRMNSIFYPSMDTWEKSTDIYYELDLARLGLWRNEVRYSMVRMTTAGAMLGVTTNVPVQEEAPTPTPSSGGNGSQPQPTAEPTKAMFPTWTPRPTWKPWWED